jgi:hypothetical protein
MSVSLLNIIITEMCLLFPYSSAAFINKISKLLSKCMAVIKINKFVPCEDTVFVLAQTLDMIILCYFLQKLFI